MSRQRIVTISLLLLPLAVAAFWYFSPYLTLHAMRNAAQAHDAAALAQHVDFPRVRESLKHQLHAVTDRKAEEAGDNVLARAGAAFGAALGNFVADKLVDTLVTPERLADAMREGKVPGREPDVNTPPGDGSDAADREKRWAFERRGVNVFVAQALGRDNRPDIGFVLERGGFATWRLVGIELPDPDR